MSAHWDIALSKPPRILAMSPGSEHGRQGAERYRMDGFWCLNLFAGSGELIIGEHRLPFAPGYASITVPQRDIEFRFTGKTILTWAHFVPQPGGATTAIPAMLNLGKDFPGIRQALQAVASHRAADSATQSPRAAARLWDILWELCERGQGADEVHAGLRLALDYLLADLARPMSVAGLARRIGLSQSQLTRLFRARFGCTVGAYLRRMRVERACHFLVHSTRAISAIAASVGISDAHHFNKLLRLHAGASPRKIRATGKFHIS